MSPLVVMTCRSLMCSPETPSTKANVVPANWRTCLPDSTSHQRTELSALALTTCAPSLLNATRVTVSECPVTGQSGFRTIRSSSGSPSGSSSSVQMHLPVQSCPSDDQICQAEGEFFIHNLQVQIYFII